MFGKRQSKGSAVTVIAAGTTVEGTLRVKGLIQIDGAIDGSLFVEGLVSVGPDGKIHGDVHADELSIGGRVDGSVVARSHLHVLATGRVLGEARYATLEVDRGGIMSGRTMLSADETDKIVVANAEVVAHEAAE